MNSKQQVFDLAVVGGGISGLIFAWEAARAGQKVLVLEAAAEVGGAVGSAELAGVEVPTGAEAFAVAGGQMRTLVSELGLDSQLATPAANSSFIVADPTKGKARAYASPKHAIMGMPASPFFAPKNFRQGVKILGFYGFVRGSLERFLPVKFAADPGISIGAFVQKRYGRRVLQRLVAPIVYGVHSADPMQMELRALIPNFQEKVQVNGSAQQTVEALLEARGIRAGSGAAVYSLKPSMAEFPRALARQITELGGQILTASPVQSLDFKAATQSWLLSTEATKYQAANLVLAAAPEISAQLLQSARPKLASKIVQAPATNVRLISLAIENHRLNHHPRGNGALVSPASKQITAKALTHGSAKWEHISQAAKAQHPNLHLVRLSYGRGSGKKPTKIPNISKFPDLALQDASLILGTEITKDQLKAWSVTDWDRVMRQSGPGHTAKLSQVTAALAQHNAGLKQGRLELAGAWRSGNGLEAITRFTRNLAQEFLTNSIEDGEKK